MLKCQLKTLERLNKEFPIGTPVRYYSVAGLPDYIESKTRSEVWLLGHGSPVVLIEGKSGGVATSHLEIVRSK